MTQRVERSQRDLFGGVTQVGHWYYGWYEFKKLYPSAHDRNQPYCAPPGHEILSFLARLREEPERDEGSSPDDGVPEKFTGHRGKGSPMMVGVGYVQREFCDGQSLASPGRWSPEARVYPSSTAWFGTGMYLALRDSLWDRKVASRSRDGKGRGVTIPT